MANLYSDAVKSQFSFFIFIFCNSGKIHSDVKGKE